MQTYKYLKLTGERNSKDCVDCQPRNPDGKQIIIRREFKNNDNVKNEYIIFDNINYLFDQLITGKFSQDSLHEIIFGNFQQKPKFDIDGGDDNKFDIIYNTIKNTIDETYKIDANLEVFSSCGYDNGKYKFSKHIIITDYVFANSNEASYFTKQILKNKMPTNCIDCVDWDINKSTQSFRLLYSKKLDSTRTKLPEGFDEIDYDIDYLDSSLVQYNYNNLIMLNKMAPINFICEKPINIDYNNNELQPLIEKVLIDTEGKYMYSGLDRSPYGYTVIKLTRLAPALCKICDREHTNDNAYVEVKENQAYFKCRRDSTKPIIYKFEENLALLKGKISSKNAERTNDRKDKVKGKHLSDYQLADILISISKDNLKFINKNTCYLYNCDKTIWEQREDDILRYIISTLINELNNLNENCENEESKINKKTFNYVESSRGAKNIYTLIKEGLRDDHFDEKLNSCDWLLPIANNKVLNLKTLEIIDRNREHMFTYSLDLNYGKHNERINNFIMKTCCDNAEAYEYLMSILGYIITGNTEKRCFFVFYGKGANGKSVLIGDMISQLLGPFSTTMAKSALSNVGKNLQNKNEHTEYKRPLIGGSRLCVINEAGDLKLDEELVKEISGSDCIDFRGIFSKNETIKKYKSCAKICILSNDKPIFSTSDSMKDRFLLFPFNARFVDKPSKNGEYARDNQTIEYIKKYAMDDLLYMVAQYSKKWYDNKVFCDEPEFIKEDRLNYLCEIDAFAGFFDSYEPSNVATRLTDLYNIYTNSVGKNEIVKKRSEFSDYLDSYEFANGVKGSTLRRKLAGVIQYKIQKKSYKPEVAIEDNINDSIDDNLYKNIEYLLNN